MAMKIKNLSNKVIGLGELSVLPGETETVPAEYEKNPTLEVYKTMKMAEITGKPSAPQKTKEEVDAEKKAAEQKAAEDAEALRKARLAALEGISDEDLGKMAVELGINPAECKDNEDVLKKVKAALKK